MTPKQKRRRHRHRIGWFRKLAGELVSCCLGVDDRSRGASWAGYRVMRIVRAKVDRKRKEVVEIVARACSGDGFDGPKFVLRDRRKFVGGQCKGILHGKACIPIDEYYRSLTGQGDVGWTLFEAQV